MICSNCQNKILIGNKNRLYKKCLSCGYELEDPLALEYDDLSEFLVVLLDETENEIAKEEEGLKEILEEYSQRSEKYKTAIDIMLSKGCFQYIYDFRMNNTEVLPEQFADESEIQNEYVRQLLYFLSQIEDMPCFSADTKEEQAISLANSTQEDEPKAKETVKELHDLYKACIKNHNIDEALKYLEVAKEMGVIEARFEYGLHLLDIPGRKKEGITELRKCASMGYERAIYRLRYMYLVGYKVEQDVEEAEKYEKMIS